MIPGSALAGDLLRIVPTLLSFAGGMIAIYIFLIFLPLLVQLMLNIFISMIRSMLKFDIRPILDLVLFPGSMLRVTFMWFVLSLYGFQFRLTFYLPDFGESATNINRRYRGLTYIAFQDRDMAEKHSHIKMAFVLSLASYLGLVVFVIMLLFHTPIVLGMYYIFPPKLVVPLYNFMLLSIGLGGMPVPEETLAVVYAILYTNPHMILNVFINTIATLIIAPYVGAEMALFIFISMTLLAIFMVMGLNPRKLEDDDFLEVFHQSFSGHN